MRKRAQLIRIDLTPMIDCVFILLVFFMATSSMQQHKSTLKLELPTLDSELSPPDTKNHSLEMSQSALVYDGTLVDREELAVLLKKCNPESVVSIYIDKYCHYEQIAPLLKLIQESGVKDIDLVVEAQ